MEVEVAVPPPPSSSSSMDFNFDSTCSSPYITAPSSPQRFPNFFFSAPASPTLFNPRHSSSSIPNTTTQADFDFGVHLPRPSLSAEELFLAGKIRPLKPPSIQPIKKSSPSPSLSLSLPPPQHELRPERASSSSVPEERTERSEEARKSVSECDDNKSNNKSGETSFLWFTRGYRKWRIKDFLLFRSASEGRASDKDPFRKYAVLSKTTAHEDVRNSSFRSAGSSGSVSRRRGPVSAHELHYTVNRAASVELKKKTLLPYKQGLLGCLGFNPPMHHFTARIGSSDR
uniref:Uncharacterized protein n=1 Tax=Cajanus cajan TaxID=3821 RepID=A0A151R3Q2_CAJCA|nr:hypothetical protein KK1_041644 [Cajanus cajan]